MKTTKIGIDLIKFFESIHDGDLKKIGLQPKMCPAGIWTEGYGHAIRNEKGVFLKGVENKEKAYKYSIVKDELQAEKLLEKDLKAYENIVIKKIKIVLKQNQFDALVSHTYNTGGSDKLFNLINKKAPIEDIKKWFENKYITVAGKQLKGLLKRRKAEFKLYNK
jgi:lysozyme